MSDLDKIVSILDEFAWANSSDVAAAVRAVCETVERLQQTIHKLTRDLDEARKETERWRDKAELAEIRDLVNREKDDE